VVTASVTGNQSFDKNWIVCDNTASSPITAIATPNGTTTQWQPAENEYFHQWWLTWSAAATDGSGVIGGQPVVRPDGTVIVPTDNASESALARSIPPMAGQAGAPSPPLLLSAITRWLAACGKVRCPRSKWMVPALCTSPGPIAAQKWLPPERHGHHPFNQSTGTTWATITRVPIDATNSGIDHFIPGLTVNKATSGSTAQLGLTYYFYASGSTSLQVGFLSSTNAGSTWERANDDLRWLPGVPTTWAATTSQGRMVGDYISSSYGTDNLAHGVYDVAYTPTAAPAAPPARSTTATSRRTPLQLA